MNITYTNKMEEDVMCRSCMTIIKRHKNQYDEKLMEKFCFCTNIVISENDECTKQFCSECSFKIESFHNYVKEAHKVDKILKCKLNLKSQQSISQVNRPEHFIEEITEKKTEREYSLLGLLLSNSNLDYSSSSLISCYDTNDFNEHDNQETFDDNDINLTIDIQTKECDGSDSIKTDNTSCLQYLLLRNDHGVHNKETLKNSTTGSRELASRADSKHKFSKTCEPCQKVFKSEHAYNEHMKRHTEKQIKCERCNKEFQSVYKLKSHIYLCLEETFKVVCKQCGLKFRNQTKLNIHVTMKHSQERPYSCDVCSKRFKFKRIRDQHMIIHSSIKPFLCDICGLSLTQANSLKDHKRIHTNENPYKCNLCDYRAKKMSVIIRHKRQHAGDRPHQCTYCDKKFYSAYDLIRHTRKHTGELPYNCPLCTRRFTSSTKRKEHIVRAHKIPLNDIPRMNKNGDTLVEGQNVLVKEG